jgi:hypothetical protein
MKRKAKTNPWGRRKVPVHGNVEPDVFAEIEELKSRYSLKTNTDALNLLIAEGLAVYRIKNKEKNDENQAE